MSSVPGGASPGASGFGRDLKFLGHSVWLCAFPVLSVALALIVLIGLPQGEEVINTITFARLMRGLSGTQYDFGQFAVFELSFAAWGMANWYASRVLLARDFDTPAPEGIALRAPSAFIGWWRELFPRALPLIGMAPIGLYFILARGERFVGAATLLVMAAVMAFIIARRHLFKSATRNPSSTYQELTPGDRLALWMAFCVSLVLLMGLAYANYWVARFLGAASVLFLALACITLFGSLVLIYLPLARGWPVMVWVPVVFYLGFAQAGWNHNHQLASRLDAEAAAPAVDARPSVTEHFRRWLAAHPGGEIVLVAAEGGASRSGWWTSHVLSVLDEATAGEFSRHVYAVSGISGGSLGAATYAALLARRTTGAHDAAGSSGPIAFPNDEACEQLVQHADDVPLAVQSECFVGRDFLSTTIGYMLFPDLLQRFLPWRMSAWDRSFGLEKTWAADWSTLFGDDSFGQCLGRLYDSARLDCSGAGGVRTDIPLVFLNSARANIGRPVSQAPVTVPHDETDDLFEAPLGMQRLPLAAVVHNSARFPVVSPGGEVSLPHDGPYWDALVDGGYFENSGAHTLHQMLRAIERDSADGPVKWDDIRKRIRIVFITNQPPARGPGPQKEPSACTTELSCARRPISQEELLTPPIGLYASRSARAHSARRELLRFLGPDVEPRSFNVALAGAAVTERQPAMSWYITPESREAMWQSVSEEPARSELCRLIVAVTHHDAQCAGLDRFALPRAAGSSR
ncbi:hypothetical protein [Piscinibacter sp.]|jgi:hypothetical protein|uniref:hypothetical protein n=1 Tax=Piscinibacter sp. TaxID=1903157 RepID=UPI00355A8BF5